MSRKVYLRLVYGSRLLSRQFAGSARRVQDVQYYGRVNATLSNTASSIRPLRPGLSLLEIIVALAILVGSAVLLAQMTDLGARHAERASEITEAQTVAQNIMHELLIGQRPLASVDTPQPVDPWSPWDVSILVSQVGFSDLVEVTVAVVPAPPSETEPTTSNNTIAGPQNMDPPTPSASNGAVGSASLGSLETPPTYRLTRWMRREALSTIDTDTELDSEAVDPILEPTTEF